MRIKILVSVIPALLTVAPVVFAESTPAPAANTTASTKASASTESATSTQTATTPTATGGGNAGTADNMISAFGLLGYFYSGTGLGLGARYQKVVASKVVFKDHPTIKDEFGIEGGLDYLHYSFNYGVLGTKYDWTYNQFSILVGVTWNVWFNDRLAVYPKIDIGYGFGSLSSSTSGLTEPGGYGGVFVQGAAGVIYKLDAVSLRAELGTESLRLGAGLQF